MTVQQLSEQKGFSLVEMMVAVCIMAIAFAGLATMEIACINGNSIASNVTMGITLAQDKMEELKSLHIDDPDHHLALQCQLEIFLSKVDRNGKPPLLAGWRMQTIDQFDAARRLNDQYLFHYRDPAGGE